MGEVLRYHGLESNRMFVKSIYFEAENLTSSPSTEQKPSAVLTDSFLQKCISSRYRYESFIL